MIYKFIIFAITSLFFIQTAFSAEFGEYQYSKYMAINQSLKNRQMMARRQQMKYYQNPTRNIRYPSANNPYPNIQNSSPRRLSARQRYSSSYYQKYYSN